MTSTWKSSNKGGYRKESKGDKFKVHMSEAGKSLEYNILHHY